MSKFQMNHTTLPLTIADNALQNRNLISRINVTAMSVTIIIVELLAGLLQMSTFLYVTDSLPARGPRVSHTITGLRNVCGITTIAKHTVIFQVISAASMQMTAFWNIPPCSLVEVDRRFGGAYCLHHQGDHGRDRMGTCHDRLLLKFIYSPFILIFPFH
jgi:hypothetical protein